MTTMKWLRRASLPGLVAVAATVVAGPASASSLTSVSAEYAAQSVLAAHGAITIPAVEVLTYTTGAATAGSIIAGSFTLTFTLPAGVQTSGAVTATVVNVVGLGCAPQSTLLPFNAQPSNTVTFQVPTTPLALAGDVCTVTLQGGGTGAPLSVTGATALEAIVASPPFIEPETTINYKAQLTSNTSAHFPVDGSALSQPFANSKSGLRFYSGDPETPGFEPLVIDVGTAGLGKKFLQGGVDTLTADLGAVRVVGVGSDDVSCGLLGAFLCDQTGVTAFTIGAGQITITMTGNFNNIASAFLTPFGPGSSTDSGATSNPCGGGGTAATTVTPTTITFAGLSLGVPLGTNVWAEVCIVANGTGIIGPNPGGEALTASVSSTPPTTQKDPLAALLPYTYNGSIQQILYTDANPIYPNYIRIVNNGPTIANVIPVIQTETGASASGTTITVPGNNNVLVPFATIATSAGLTLGAGNFRTSTLFLTKGAACNNNLNGGVTGGANCPVSVSNLIGEPSGNVNMMGSGAAP